MVTPSTLSNGTAHATTSRYRDPDVSGDLWERIRQGFAILPAVSQNRHIHTRNRDFWFGLQQTYVDQIAQRAQPYLHRIVEEIERRGMPAEIALLPIVESQYRPHALSPVNAAGIWQMIPATGKRFGLKQNAWYDGRKDIIASTAAALSYLQYLHQRFHGNWLNALAAYNCGEGLVDAAIDANRARRLSTDFWSLHLPAETRAYIPRLLAIASVVAEPERYNVALLPIQNRPAVAEIRVNGQIKLDKIAKLAGLSLQELRALNPGFQSTATEPRGQAILLVPVENVWQVQHAIAKLPPAQRQIAAVESTLPDEPIQLSTQPTSSDLEAQEHDTRFTADEERELHPHTTITQQSGSALATMEHQLILPPKAWSTNRNVADSSRWGLIKAGLNAESSNGRNQSVLFNRNNSDHTPSARYVKYRVREGDSLWLISQRFRVTVEQLCRWNDLLRTSPDLAPGHILRIYANSGAV